MSADKHLRERATEDVLVAYDFITQELGEPSASQWPRVSRWSWYLEMDVEVIALQWSVGQGWYVLPFGGRVYLHPTKESTTVQQLLACFSVAEYLQRYTPER